MLTRKAAIGCALICLIAFVLNAGLAALLALCITAIWHLPFLATWGGYLSRCMCAPCYLRGRKEELVKDETLAKLLDPDTLSYPHRPTSPPVS